MATLRPKVWLTIYVLNTMARVYFGVCVFIIDDDSVAKVKQRTTNVFCFGVVSL